MRTLLGLLTFEIFSIVQTRAWKISYASAVKVEECGSNLKIIDIFILGTTTEQPVPSANFEPSL